MRLSGFCLLVVFGFFQGSLLSAQEKAKRPNILWITCEDMGPHLGCYGDAYANTPNLDKFSTRSLRYLNAWSNAPVCAPARTTIISAMYAPSAGAEHMRSMVRLPANISLFPVYLRRAGYYCTNWIKEDYNLDKAGKVWDESSKKAHYKNRKDGQPFFAVFNFIMTHESQIRTKGHKLVHDPAKAPVPPYHPDTPEVRHDWAQYYDNITAMDKEVGRILKELEEAGLADDTIVFYFSDHGSGMPRNKRFPYDSGLHVPMLVHFPKQFQDLAPKEYGEGGTTDRLVSFVDLAPTVLSLAGEKAPEHFQGRAFLGKHQAAENDFVFGFRGRMDEKYDLIRSARDKKFSYIRNFLPHKIQGQYLDYMFQTPTTKVWKKMFDEGKLNAVQSFFWKPRPAEELYNLSQDPHEVKNLAGSKEHQETLVKLRTALKSHLLRTKDTGLLAEAEVHARSQGSTPYELARDPAKYACEAVIDAAYQASEGSGKISFQSADSGIRYWSVMQDRIASRKCSLEALKDSSPSVRIVAAECLGKFGSEAESNQAIDVLLSLASIEKHGVYVTMQALNALEDIGPKAARGLPTIKQAVKGNEALDQRLQSYVPRLIENMAAQWGGKKGS